MVGVFAVQGAIPMGEVEWEMARILQGRPAAGKELTEQHIPLEAGLYHAVSLNKGCYMGQETLAKVHKLSAVKQQLQGLLLDDAVQPGTPLLSGHSLPPSHSPFQQHYILSSSCLAFSLLRVLQTWLAHAQMQLMVYRNAVAACYALHMLLCRLRHCRCCT